MENDALDVLADIGYTGELKDEILFRKAVEEGIKNNQFRELIVWISGQLTSLLNLDESVSSATDEDTSSFLMEISSLIKELGCPFRGLVEGPVTERFGSKDQRLLLLDYLLSELMAARIIQVDQPDRGPELRIQESDTAKMLKALLLALQFPRPPDNITAAALFTKVEAKLKEVMSRAPPQLIGKPIVNGRLSAAQWETLKQLQTELQQEYSLRRDLLLKRLDVTIQSFQWSEKAKANENAIAKKFGEKRSSLRSESNVELADILAARQDLAVVVKTSSSSLRKNTQSSIQKVIIGKVPDRGGRPCEQEAPPPEMPSWQKDRAQGGGGGRGGFSRGGGGRVQGGWNDRGDQRQNENRGGHQERRNHSDNRGGQAGYHDYRGSQGGKEGYHDYRSGQGNRDGYHQDNRDGGYRGGHRGGGRGRGRDNR